MRELVENYAAHPELVNNVDWYFMPVINPDGYQFSHDSVNIFPNHFFYSFYRVEERKLYQATYTIMLLLIFFFGGGIKKQILLNKLNKIN